MLRPATTADLDLLVLHRRRMWEAMGALARDAPDLSEATYRHWLLPLLAGGQVIGWVETDDHGTRPLGSGLLWFQEWHPRPMVPRGTIPYLLSVFVEPTARGRGIARAIAEAAIAAARRAGHPRIALHASDEGRALYASLGFTPRSEMVLDLLVLDSKEFAQG